MQKNVINLQLETCYKNLKIINGVEFTPREIDIIACLLSGRKYKTISDLLPIAPRTVETNVNNIRRKLNDVKGGNIIDFIEKSGKAGIIRQHYKYLLIQREFEQCLKEISTLIKKEQIVCSLHTTSNEEDFSSFTQKLEQDLKSIGIETIVKTAKEYLSYSPLKVEKAKYDIYIIYKKEKEKFFQDIHKFPQNFKNSIFLFLDEVCPEFVLKELKNIIYLNFKKEEYYSSFFYLLEKIFPHKNLEKIVSKFKTQHDEVQHSRDIFPFFNLINKRKIFVLVSIMAVVCLGVAFFIKNNDQKIDQKFELQKDTSIRSDLNIPRDNTLLKRSGLIKKIDNKLKGNKEIKAVVLLGIVGLGGVGKTTLARAYGRNQKNSLVWELNAETRNNIMTSFKDLAYALANTKDLREEIELIQKIQDQNEKEKQIIFFVKNKLKKHSNWLLIYDNIVNFQEMKNYFPHDPDVWGHGKVIITTRDSNIKNTMFINPENVIEVGELNEKETLELFCKILYNKEPEKILKKQKEAALKFLKNIPPFPLDVSLAAYYIKDTHSSYDQYLKRIDRFSEDFEKTQKNLLKEISEYTKTRYGIIISSIENLINTNPDFKELLFLMALLDSQNIPKRLFVFYKDVLVVDKFFHDLRKNGFLTSNASIGNKEENFNVSIHRSIQNIIFAYFKKWVMPS